MPTTKSTYTLGMIGQKQVLDYYLKNAYCLIDQNFQYYQKGKQGRTAEIDLIFEKKHILYFVEVKSRSNNKFGFAQEQINSSKLKNLYTAVKYFMMKKQQYTNYTLQFDVAVINGEKLEIMENAYSFDGFEL
jgi:putative endonuclease